MKKLHHEHVGEWLSLVEHLVRDQGVGGSNPLSPTNYFQFRFFLLMRPRRLPFCWKLQFRPRPAHPPTEIQIQ